jgi:hypothetical protein
MDLPHLLDRPEVLAAFLSFLAAAFAAIATWRAPISAAKLAERMRQTHERQSEARRMKMHIFVTLLQERATFFRTTRSKC